MENAGFNNIKVVYRKQFFEKIVKHYSDLICNLAYQLTGNVVEAEDITQEVFVKAYKSLWQFKNKAKITTWLYRITVNVYKNRIRDEQRHREKIESQKPEDYDITWLTENLSKTIDNPSKTVEYNEKREIIKHALSNLDAQHRLIIVLFDIEYRSYKEIAKIMKCSVNNVKAKLFYARNLLRKILLPIIKNDGVRNKV